MLCCCFVDISNRIKKNIYLQVDHFTFTTHANCSSDKIVAEKCREMSILNVMHCYFIPIYRSSKKYIQLTHQQLIRKFIGVHPGHKKKYTEEGKKIDKHLNKPPLFRTSFYRERKSFSRYPKRKAIKMLNKEFLYIFFILHPVRKRMYKAKCMYESRDKNSYIFIVPFEKVSTTKQKVEVTCVWSFRCFPERKYTIKIN